MKLALLLILPLILTACTSGTDVSHPSTSPTPTPPIVSPTLSGQTQLNETLFGLVNMRIPMACQFEKVHQEGTLTGQIHTYNGHFVVDAELIPSQGESPLILHALGDDAHVYQWNEGANQGLQIETPVLLEAGSRLQELARDNSQFGALSDLLSNLDYSCEPWTEDPDTFTLPESISFTNITGLVSSLNSVSF